MSRGRLHPAVRDQLRAALSEDVPAERIEDVLASIRATWALLEYPSEDNFHARQIAAWIASGIAAAERGSPVRPESYRLRLVKGD